MAERKGNLEFHSAVGPCIEKFIEEKRACGYKYATESGSLRRLDRFLHEQGLANAELPRDLVEQWVSKRRNESTRNHRARIGLVRRLAVFVARQGQSAFIPDSRLAPMQHPNLAPHIFSQEEVQNLLKAVDNIQPTQRSPLRYLVMPEVFRVLYCCGLRVGEALRLKVGDVDLA